MSKYIIKESTLRRIIAEKVKAKLMEFENPKEGGFDKIVHSHNYEFGLKTVNKPRFGYDSYIKVYELNDRGAKSCGELYDINVEDMDDKKMDGAYDFFFATRQGFDPVKAEKIGNNKRMWGLVDGYTRTSIKWIGLYDDRKADNEEEKGKKVEGAKEPEGPSLDYIKKAEKWINDPNFGDLSIGDEY